MYALRIVDNIAGVVKDGVQNAVMVRRSGQRRLGIQPAAFHGAGEHLLEFCVARSKKVRPVAIHVPYDRVASRMRLYVLGQRVRYFVTQHKRTQIMELGVHYGRFDQVIEPAFGRLPIRNLTAEIGVGDAGKTP